MDPTVETLLLERDFLLRLLELTNHDDPKVLLEEALHVISRASGARHCYIEIVDAAAEGPDARYSATTEGLDPSAVRRMLSSTIIKTTLTEGRVVETRAAFEDPRFLDAPSVRGQRIDAVVCVPIGPKPMDGVVYIQGSQDGRPFSAEVVRLCTIFARYLASLSPRLVRRVRENAIDPTARWRDKLVGAEVLIGSSQAIAEVLKATAIAAPRDIGVLITGPSGSGKSALAKVIAMNGARAKGPFIELNCANLPTALVESELFGALPGAHSTANKRVIGKVESADHGTLLLDEVAELTPEAQAKLLQFLQDGSFYQLGGTRPQRADVRLIAASNANLPERVKQGTFREDLFYRLNVLEIQIPSLEHRRIDIAPLAASFLSSAISRLALPPLQLSNGALRALETADWPGNIRQLKNTIDAAAVRVLADDASIIEPNHLFPGMRETEGASTFHAIMRGYQRQILVEALARHQWNVTEAAGALGLGRSSLYQLIKTLGVERG